MQKQSGYILLFMMLILILGASAFLYAGLNQSAPTIKAQQSQNQLKTLQPIKQRLILFARENDLFCTTTRPGHLPQQLNNQAFGFNDLGDLSAVTLDFETTQESIATVSCSDVIQAVNVCDFEQNHVASLRLNSQPNIQLKLYKNELGCSS